MSLSPKIQKLKLKTEEERNEKKKGNRALLLLFTTTKQTKATTTKATHKRPCFTVRDPIKQLL